jgi:hypothetical protein
LTSFWGVANGAVIVPLFESEPPGAANRSHGPAAWAAPPSASSAIAAAPEAASALQSRENLITAAVGQFKARRDQPLSGWTIG